MTDARAAALLAELEATAAAITTVDLAEAIGRLEGIKTVLLTRLIQPAAAAVPMPVGAGTGAPDRLLSAKEAAQRMGVSRDWLYQNAGRLKFACRLGRRWKFSQSGLEEWMRGRRK